MVQLYTALHQYIDKKQKQKVESGRGKVQFE